MCKERIVMDVLPEQKAELKKKAEALNLSLKDFLVLKGLDQLKIKKVG